MRKLLVVTVAAGIFGLVVGSLGSPAGAPPAPTLKNYHVVTQSFAVSTAGVVYHEVLCPTGEVALGGSALSRAGGTAQDPGVISTDFLDLNGQAYGFASWTLWPGSISGDILMDVTCAVSG